MANIDLKSMAKEWAKKKLHFEHACDLDGNPVGRTKYAMISQREWREIRACLLAVAPTDSCNRRHEQ